MIRKSKIAVLTQKAVRNQLPGLNRKISNIIFFRTAELVGPEGLHRKGPKLLGRNSYECAIMERRMPPLRNLIPSLGAIGMRLIITLECPEGKGIQCPIAMTMENKFVEKHLKSFLRTIYHGSFASSGTDEMRLLQRDKLRQLCSVRSRIRWDSLLAFFIACGYDVNIVLESKIPTENQALLARLNYPH